MITSVNEPVIKHFYTCVINNEGSNFFINSYNALLTPSNAVLLQSTRENKSYKTFYSKAFCLQYILNFSTNLNSTFHISYITFKKLQHLLYYL